MSNIFENDTWHTKSGKICSPFLLSRYNMYVSSLSSRLDWNFKCTKGEVSVRTPKRESFLVTRKVSPLPDSKKETSPRRRLTVTYCTLTGETRIAYVAPTSRNRNTCLRLAKKKQQHQSCKKKKLDPPKTTLWWFPEIWDLTILV